MDPQDNYEGNGRPRLRGCGCRIGEVALDRARFGQTTYTCCSTVYGANLYFRTCREAESYFLIGAAKLELPLGH